jgi:cytochrome c oxidase cbb3-type subunit 1
MMWRAVDEYGNLSYSFIDTVIVLHPYYTTRAIGGTLYLIGVFIWAFNIYKTITAGRDLSDKEVNTNRSPMGGN